MSDDVAVLPVGDSALVVRFAERLDPWINGRAMQLASDLTGRHVPGVRDVVPSFRAVTIHYDPVRTDVRALMETLSARLAVATDDPMPAAGPTVEIPVCYGGEFGPDLALVAEWAHIGQDDVVVAHAREQYRVYMLGFSPGFAYLGDVAAQIAMPRRSTPRGRVTAGSVAIAGRQTAVYPAESPGGWNLIGRTPLAMFDAERPRPSLLAPGDRVSFTPITPDEFRRIRREHKGLRG